MRATLLSIGDELTSGVTADANASWLARELAARAIEVVEIRVVPDDRQVIADAMTALATQCEILLVTGGLGPTADDLTRHALGDAATPGQPLETDPAGVTHLEKCFAGRPRPVSNDVQAQRPQGMRLIPNRRGTAMGIAGQLGSCSVFVMPGPPSEMHRMFRSEVAESLPAVDGEVIRYGEVHEFGLGESAAAERLGELTDRDHAPRVGLTHGESIVTARIRARGPAGETDAVLDATRRAIVERWTPYVFGHDGDTLAASAGRLLAERGRTLAVAESCTGGWLGKLIVDVPGSSGYFAGGWVTYTDTLKTSCLGVPAATLERHGAVSREVAEAMAVGALDTAGADEALSITGIAGPDGGTEAKRVGTVFIGHACRANGGVSVTVRGFRYPGGRGDVRDRSAKSALQMLRFGLMDVGPEVELLWER